VLCKKSIWIATRTSDVNEPGEFSPVEPGIGCVSESTAKSVYGGVEFLSSVGVQVFDGQKCVNVSEQINADILPLDYANINKYWGHYDAERRRYFLGTPTETWVHDIDFGRWYKRSLVALRAVDFPPEVLPISWNGVSGSWDSITTDWSGYDPTYKPDRNVFIQGTLLHAEDPASATYFNQSFVPRWRSKSIMAPRLGVQVIVKQMQFRYKGAGEIQTQIQDSNGVLIDYMTRRLPDTGGLLQDAVYIGTKAGLRATMDLQLLSGFVEFDMLGISVQLDTDTGISL
jgi:hypothetical protein